MTERLTLELTKIWVEDWTSLDRLSGATRLFGDLRIEIGGQQLPGVHVMGPNTAQLNKCASEMIGQRQIKKETPHAGCRVWVISSRPPNEKTGCESPHNRLNLLALS